MCCVRSVARQGTRRAPGRRGVGGVRTWAACGVAAALGRRRGCAGAGRQAGQGACAGSARRHPTGGPLTRTAGDRCVMRVHVPVRVKEPIWTVD